MLDGIPVPYGIGRVTTSFQRYGYIFAILNLLTGREILL